MAKILVVDDEKGIADLLIMAFEENGHEARYAASGKSAIELIPLYGPELIISDIKMTPMNGIELLHWCNANNVKVPFIFITGFSDILLLQEAIDLGAYSLIKKPFYEEDILETVSEALGLKATGGKKKLSNDDFCRIDLQKFVSGSQVCCSIFVKIRDDHFVKLAEKNDPLPKEKLIYYKEKNLEFLYVLKTEFSELVGFNMKLMNAVGQNKKVTKEKFLNFVGYSNGIILEQAFVKNLDKNILLDVQNYSEMVLGLMAQKKALFDMVINLSEHSDYLYAHSLSTAVLSYLIAKEVGWHSEPTLCRVFLSGLLHDIGLREVKKELIIKNPTFFSDKEKEEYEFHPTMGMEILNSLGCVPQDVILAAYQHHEDCIGGGYPLKMMKSKISPISRLVSVADIVDQEVIGERDLSLNSYKRAISSASGAHQNRYDVKFLDALKSVLKIV